MDVNSQTVVLTAGGELALTGSPTGSGVYTVGTFGGAASQALTSITGGSDHAVITLQPATAGQYFFITDSATLRLQQNQTFVPLSVDDCLTLRLDPTGTYWKEIIPRGHF